MQRYRSGHNGADSKSVWEQSHEGSNPSRCATSPRTTYRSRRLFYKSHLSLILSRLLSKPDPLSPVWVRRCAAVFSGHQKISILDRRDRCGRIARPAIRPAALLRRTSVLPQAKPRRRRNPFPPSILTKGWKPPLAAGTQKERHDLWSCLSFWKGRLKSIFPRNRTNPPQSGGPRSQPSVSGCDLERRSSGVSAL